MQETKDRVYLAGPLTSGDNTDIPSKDLDGIISICGYRDSMRPIDAEYQHDDRLNHRDFLFLLSITDELEKLPDATP